MVSNLEAQPSKYRIIKDLRNDWFVYNDGSFKLFTNEKKASHIKLNFSLEETNKSDYLFLESPESTSMFINNQLIIEDSISLFGVSQFGNHQFVQIDVLGEDFRLSELNTYILRSKVVSQQGVDQYLEIKTRPEFTGYSDVYMTVLIFVMMSIASARSLQRKSFKELFSFGNLISIKPRLESLLSTSVYSLSNLGLVLLYSIVVGGIMSIVSLNEVDVMGFGLFDSITSSTYTFGFIHALIAFVFMLLKFPLIRIFSGIFHISRYSEFQFFIYFRLSFFLSIAVLVLVIFDASSNFTYSEIYPQLLFKALLLFVFVRVFYSFLILNKEVDFRKLHLFIYLCGTELIPQLVLLKLLVS